MKKSERHEQILELIKNKHLETQDDLVSALREYGLDCTQATVSRDIKELRLTKIQTEDGRYRYAVPEGNDQHVVGKLLEAFSNGFVSSDFSGNIVVIKTVVGMAPACAYAVDAVQWQEVVGTIAGEDTILVVTKSLSASKKFLAKLDTLIK